MQNYNATLQQIIIVAKAQIERVSEEEMALKPKAEKWSKKEILGHLVDSAYNNHQRFIRATEQDDLIFGGYDQVGWVKKNNYQSRDSKEVLELWAITNFHLSKAIETIPEKFLSSKTTRHNFHQVSMNRVEENATTSLAYLIWDYLFHVEHHLSQIIPTYERVLKEFEA